MIQVIEKHADNWHMIVYGVQCVLYKTGHLYTDGLLPHPANADNGLRWRINRKWVSYRQIKDAIRKNINLLKNN